MILLLDTSTPTCRLSLVSGDVRHDNSWESGRTLAKGLLGYIEDNLAQMHATWTDIGGVVAYKGPGSFTGLRIGLTVLNTLADSESIPIVGTTGDDWQSTGLGRLRSGDNDQLVMPEYGADAHITTPRK
ncbi:tRNA (adenosine(37)-N6)-threonylcarbamoyltransferase complex dimerization subunit type 1 TsaB [Candidatus Saccharibacteria bacterium]|nr:tRNA (adenosine(37)-N6)-threonylcarbamoyltransferase complex dimerization subunit type 1 TsaB [Candidatus Saccharibacteria bacterium]